MSGIFRHSAPASNNNNTSETTPQKRISFGAFCTSPGTLQDVTMDNAYGVGYRSPCVSMQQYHGASSPAVQGRSVREFEEHTAQLRKENFNLKLRLYFIEENMPALKSNGGDGCDTVMRELIDHKVEVEMLRRELEEKKCVLKDALQAIEDLENIQKETETNYEAKVDDLKQKIHMLEMDRHVDKSENNEILNTMLGRCDIVTEHVNTLQKIRELEAQIKTDEETISELQNKVSFFDGILEKREKTIEQLQDKTKKLEYENAELQEELDNCKKEMASSEHIQLEIKQYRVEMANKICYIDELEEQNTDLHKKIDSAANTIQSMKQTIKTQQMEIQKLRSEKDVENKASSLDTLMMLDVNKKHTTNFNSNADATPKQSHSLSDTDALKNTDHSIQLNLESTLEHKEQLIKSLQTENKKKTADLQNLVNHELWEKNREIERLTKVINQVHNASAGIENETLIMRLRQEVHDARSKAERAEQFREECSSMCSTLTERLEELAGFLNSMLKNKDVLGLLAIDRRRAMRKAVDRSLDLSKNLNRTLSVTNTSITEHNLSQLSNLSQILQDDSIFLPQDDTVLMQAESHAIEILQAENRALKKELDKRRTSELKKDRRSLPAVAALENQSESEAWSEPDRKVSLARMGLEDHSASLNISKDLNSKNANSDSESETDADDALSHSRSAKLRTQQQETMERLIAQRDERILQIQCQLVEADNRLKKENLRVLDLTNEVRDLRERNERLQTEVFNIETNTQNNSELSHNESMWLRQIEEQSQLLERIEKERDRLDNEARIATQQVIDFKALLEKLHLQHAKELQNVNEREQQKLEEMRKHMDLILKQQLEEQQQQQKEILKQLSELQRQYMEAQRNIDSHIENAKESRQALVESELNARTLKKQLDESTLQATQAVMDRSKALNEKIKLEHTIDEYKQMLESMENERDTLLKRLNEMESLQKITAAAAANVNKNSPQQKTTQLNGSDISQSGYTSEEIAGVANVTAPASTSGIDRQVNGHERHNNSSPDLGIESDAGRVSSVELTNVHRSLLMKIEVPTTEISQHASKDADKKNASEKDDLDIENRPPNANKATVENSSVPSSIVHDCAKVEQENAELKRKLLRTKRQFEETYQKLRIQNQVKAQIERDIKTQITKTHNVLKNVRSNMETEK